MTPVSAYFASNQHNSRGLDMLDTLLIANRGEIACRIATTAKRLGIRTVAIYSDADAQSRHVDSCDVAVHVGGSEASQSYLQIEKIIAAAQKTGAQAIHPGYGFLAENEAFANACKDAGILFVGPPAQAKSDRKSTRLNSSHVAISYAVFCLKKKIKSRTSSSSLTSNKSSSTTTVTTN